MRIGVGIVCAGHTNKTLAFEFPIYSMLRQEKNDTSIWYYHL